MERLTISEAAKRLDLTQEAVRARIRRGTIEYEKGEDGKTYVYLTEEETGLNSVTNPVVQAYIETLKSEIEAWKQIVSTRDEELRRRDEELKRKDHLLAAALERIPAIEPPADVPPDVRESTVTASEEASKGEVPPEPKTAQSQPWWRRIFK